MPTRSEPGPDGPRLAPQSPLQLRTRQGRGWKPQVSHSRQVQASAGARGISANKDAARLCSHHNDSPRCSLVACRVVLPYRSQPLCCLKIHVPIMREKRCNRATFVSVGEKLPRPLARPDGRLLGFASPWSACFDFRANPRPARRHGFAGSTPWTRPSPCLRVWFRRRPCTACARRVRRGRVR